MGDESAVWREIVDAADELPAEVVDLGSRGRGPLGSAVPGSVSRGVVHHSRRPVLLVPESTG